MWLTQCIMYTVHCVHEVHVAIFCIYVCITVYYTFALHFRAKLHEEVAIAERTVAEKTQTTNELHQQLRWANKHATCTKGVTWVRYAFMQPCSSLEPRLSVLDFVAQLWRTDFSPKL